jgi:hypothetical protein
MVLIIVIFVFFAIIGLLFLSGWHSTRDKNMLGGVIVLVASLIILSFILFLASKRYQQEHPAGSTLPDSGLIQNN